jgi:hypothetical protein
VLSGTTVTTTRLGCTHLARHGLQVCGFVERTAGGCGWEFAATFGHCTYEMFMDVDMCLGSMQAYLSASGAKHTAMLMCYSQVLFRLEFCAFKFIAEWRQSDSALQSAAAVVSRQMHLCSSVHQACLSRFLRFHHSTTSQSKLIIIIFYPHLLQACISCTFRP